MVRIVEGMTVAAWLSVEEGAEEGVVEVASMKKKCFGEGGSYASAIAF